MKKIIFNLIVICNLFAFNYHADEIIMDSTNLEPDGEVVVSYVYSNPEPECPVTSEVGSETCEIDESPFDATGKITSKELTYDEFGYNQTIFDYSNAEFKYVNKSGEEIKTTDASINGSGSYTINDLPFGTKVYTIVVPIIETPYRSVVTASSNGKSSKPVEMAKNSNIEINYSTLEDLIYLDSPQTSRNGTSITNADVIDLLGISIKDAGTDITSTFQMFDNKKTTSINEAAPIKIGAYGVSEEKIYFSTTDNQNVRDRWVQDSSEIDPFEELYFDIMAIMNSSCFPYETNNSILVTIAGRDYEFIDYKETGLDGKVCLSSDSSYKPVDDEEYTYEDFVTYDISLKYNDRDVTFDKEFRKWYPTQFSYNYNFNTGEGDILEDLSEVRVNPVYMRFEYDDRGSSEEFNYYTFIENFENMSHNVVDGMIELEQLEFSLNNSSTIPTYWNDGYFDKVAIDATPVLIDDMYKGINVSFESYLPQVIFDSTMQLPYITIDDENYFKTSNIVDEDGTISSKFIIERFSGRIYNLAGYGECETSMAPFSCDDYENDNLAEETEDEVSIRAGQNDKVDVDMVLKDLTENAMPLRTSVLSTAFDYDEIIDSSELGYNKLNITYKTKITYTSKMYGYNSTSNSKYYAVREDVTEKEYGCVASGQPVYPTKPNSCGMKYSVGGLLFNPHGLKKWLHQNLALNFPSYISDNERYQEWASDASRPTVYFVKGSNPSAHDFYVPEAGVIKTVTYEEWEKYFPMLDKSQSTSFSSAASWLGVAAWDDEDGDVTDKISVKFESGVGYCGGAHKFRLSYQDDSRLKSNSMPVIIYVDSATISEDICEAQELPDGVG